MAKKNENPTEGAFEKAWMRMLNRPGFKFRNLNLREQDAMKQMMHDMFMAQMQIQAARGSDVSGDDLKNAIAEGFKGLQSSMGPMVMPTGPGGTAIPSEELLELMPTFFDTDNVKTNIDDVKMDGKDVSGVDSTIEELRRLKSGGK